jgi:hypothetical protein
MMSLRQTGICLAALLPALAVLPAAGGYFIDGLAVDAAVPVPAYMIAQRGMTQRVYVEAAGVLAGASPRDGAVAIARGEAMLLSGAPPASQIPLLTQGVLEQPASARGWLLLAQATAPSDRKRSAILLARALALAPHNYWLAGSLARTSALLWRDLDEAGRAAALGQTRLLWEREDLHGQLRDLLSTQQGINLAARAFAGRPEEIRALNRWLAQDENGDAP